MWHAPGVFVERAQNEEAWFSEDWYVKIHVLEFASGLCDGGRNFSAGSLSVGEWIINEEFFDAKQEALQMHEPVLNTTGQYVG